MQFSHSNRLVLRPYPLQFGNPLVNINVNIKKFCITSCRVFIQIKRIKRMIRIKRIKRIKRIIRIKRVIRIK